MLLFLFLGAFLCLGEHMSTIIESVKGLRKFGNYSTFYELFDLSEGATLDEIKKAHRKMMRRNPPSGVSREEYEIFLTSALSALTEKRSEYDMFLNNSKYLFVDEKKNYKNYPFLLVLVTFVAAILVDVLLYMARYVCYLKKLEKYRNSRRKKEDENGKKRKKVSLPSQPHSFLISLLKRCVGGVRMR